MNELLTENVNWIAKLMMLTYMVSATANFKLKFNTNTYLHIIIGKCAKLKAKNKIQNTKLKKKLKISTMTSIL